jgi:NAD+-dependent secondary alcohol dehydrogenase Adh1
VIGYGENINIPTLDVVSREISFIGTYSVLQALMTLTAAAEGEPAHDHPPAGRDQRRDGSRDGGRLQGRGILVPARTA